MNREFLKGLGLEDEAIDKIMAEHGKTVNSTKEELTGAQSELESLKGQLKDRDTQLADLSTKATGNEELQKQIETLRAENKEAADKYQAELTQKTYDFALERALTDAKAKNPKAVKALLDTEIIKLDGETLVGINDQLEKLKESDSYLFDVEQQQQKPPAYNPGGGRGNDPKPTDPYAAGAARAAQRHNKGDDK